LDLSMSCKLRYSSTSDWAVSEGGGDAGVAVGSQDSDTERVDISGSSVSHDSVLSASIVHRVVVVVVHVVTSTVTIS
jgi:hypothetical protein